MFIKTIDPILEDLCSVRTACHVTSPTSKDPSQISTRCPLAQEQPPLPPVQVKFICSLVHFQDKIRTKVFKQNLILIFISLSYLLKINVFWKVKIYSSITIFKNTSCINKKASSQDCIQPLIKKSDSCLYKSIIFHLYTT